ncbi:MAG: dihydroorotate dehydrogenase electron transfer subunit [Planctomycetes bacterium]|uniref:dihydroorotate dehydrogenase electron transfer subunit n=1 Tax=Candidatus Wunengus californicus TaxID=3367619 RepID=UPI00402A12E6|nr:dihydroorotate dehydrogenase electron transfer subunit [Planctomycetota bacterium]
MIEQPVTVKICDSLEESQGVKTFFFKLDLNFEPGQFLMVWIPLLDEKPFTISYIQKGLVGISVLKRGMFTNILHSKKVGDILGIRGPYGRGFSLKPDSNSCVVGGGIGMASLATLVDRLNLAVDNQRGHVTVVQGARTAAEIIYQKRFRDMKLCTEDGTAGFKGTTVDLLKDLLKKQRFQKVYTCGSEKMLHKVVELCRGYGIECEVSLERYIKCGFGICGQCDCSGQRICIDGPIFNTEELSRMEDFGKITITETGERVIH